MITTADLAGYTASTMVLFTFMTKDMRLLRVLAIFSNVAFITYGMLVWLPPRIVSASPALAAQTSKSAPHEYDRLVSRSVSSASDLRSSVKSSGARAIFALDDVNHFTAVLLSRPYIGRALITM